MTNFNMGWMLFAASVYNTSHARTLLDYTMHMPAMVDRLSTIGFQFEGGEMICGEWSADFYMIFDLSRSFRKELHGVGKNAKHLIGALKSRFPGSSFGVGSFSDKPTAELGERIDICYNNDLHLTPNTRRAVAALQNLKSRHGGDAAESQLDAMFLGAMSNSVKWSPLDSLSPTRIRIMLVATDSEYHKAGDAARSVEGLFFLRRWFKEPTFEKHKGSDATNCVDYDYPDIEQIKAALRSRNIIPVFLVRGGENLIASYRGLAENFDFAVVRQLASDSQNILSAVKSALSEITCRIAPKRQRGPALHVETPKWLYPDPSWRKQIRRRGRRNEKGDDNSHGESNYVPDETSTSTVTTTTQRVTDAASTTQPAAVSTSTPQPSTPSKSTNTTAQPSTSGNSITTTRQPSTLSKSTNTTAQPSTSSNSITTRQPSTPSKSTNTTAQPSTSSSSITTTPQPSTPSKSTNTTAQPSTSSSSITTTRQPSTLSKSANTTAQPSTSSNSITTRQPSTPSKSANTTAQPSTSSNSITTTRQPSTLSKSANTTSQPSTSSNSITTPQPSTLSTSRMTTPLSAENGGSGRGTTVSSETATSPTVTLAVDQPADYYGGGRANDNRERREFGLVMVVALGGLVVVAASSAISFFILHQRQNVSEIDAPRIVEHGYELWSYDREELCQTCEFFV